MENSGSSISRQSPVLGTEPGQVLDSANYQLWGFRVGGGMKGTLRELAGRSITMKRSRNAIIRNMAIFVIDARLQFRIGHAAEIVRFRRARAPPAFSAQASLSFRPGISARHFLKWHS